jgi:hypothetical protein
VATVFFVLVVLRRSIEIDYISDCLELWLHGVASLEDDHDVELSDVEEVNETLELILRQFRAQHETLQGKSVQEKLNSIGLDDVISVYQGLALEDTELQKCKEDNEFFEIRLTLDVVVLKSLNYR